jgi:hypothetical protein
VDRAMEQRDERMVMDNAVNFLDCHLVVALAAMA